MNKIQREMLIILFLGVPGLVICAAVVLGIIYFGETPVKLHTLINFAVGTTFLGLCWLIPLYSHRIFKRKSATKVDFDERDGLILKKAVLTAYIVLWLYFVAACVTALKLVGSQGAIPVIILPIILIGGLLIFMIAQALVTLFQYGWGGGNGGK